MPGFRDNNDHWQIDVDDLDVWVGVGPPDGQAPAVHARAHNLAHDAAHGKTLARYISDMADLRVAVAIAEVERDTARARIEDMRTEAAELGRDLDAWRRMAERGWWSRLFGR